MKKKIVIRYDFCESRLCSLFDCEKNSMKIGVLNSTKKFLITSHDKEIKNKQTSRNFNEYFSKGRIYNKNLKKYDPYGIV